MQPGQKDRSLWNDEIQWLLNIAPSAMGERGALQSTIATLERGGSPIGGNPEHITDYQLGWCAGEGAAEKWRKLVPIWRDMSLHNKALLTAHYSTLGWLPETQRTRAEGALGELAAVAIWQAEEDQLEKLLDACVNKDRQGRKELLAAARAKAVTAVKQAHAAWEHYREVHGRGKRRGRRATSA